MSSNSYIIHLTIQQYGKTIIVSISGVVARRSNPTPEARGSSQEEQPHIQGVVAVRAQESLEKPSQVEGQEGWWEEILLIQGKEQRLCFAGPAVKRYPMPKVRETQVRW